MAILFSENSGEWIIINKSINEDETKILIGPVLSMLSYLKIIL